MTGILGGLIGSLKGKLISSAIVLAIETSPYITAYPWSSGFGTKYSNPATLPADTANGIAFNI